MSRQGSEGASPHHDDRPDQPLPDPLTHFTIKVTDGNSEVFFKVKPTTALKKLMDAFCERSGRTRTSARFLFDGTRITDVDTPLSLEMQDGDTLEVHQEQVGG